MKKNLILLSALFALTTTFTKAQHAHLHVNPKWDECSFQLDSSLTQDQWHKFSQEAGLVAYFRPLVDAKPMGVGRFELSVLQWRTAIDENSGAWNNTFVHPDSDHWLVGGEQLPFPGLAARAGITRKMDVGVYWSMRPGANYGFYGAQVQYNFIDDETSPWGVSSRIGFNNLYGPDDLNYTMYGLDVLASRKFKLHSDWLSLSPYAGFSTYLFHAHEKSEVVNLNDENILGLQGMVGAVAQISIVRLGVEYNVAKVNTFSYKLGVNFNLGSNKKK